MLHNQSKAVEPKFEMSDHIPVRLVDDETRKPEPTAYPPLLPTLQTTVGMVTGNGLPKPRPKPVQNGHDEQYDVLRRRAQALAARCQVLNPYCDAAKQGSTRHLKSNLEHNLLACVKPYDKAQLIDMVRQAKRLDLEQAVAIVIGYVGKAQGDAADESDFELVTDEDDVEQTQDELADELINDGGVTDMLKETCMWTEPCDFQANDQTHKAAEVRMKEKIELFLPEAGDLTYRSLDFFLDTMKAVRRRRLAMENKQHLALPEKLLLSAADGSKAMPFWSEPYNHNQTLAEATATRNTLVMSKRNFSRVQRILLRMNGRQDPTSVYVRQVEDLMANSGMLSPRRIAALEASTDPAAVAYSFIAAQRRRQLKVVSDHQWSRFLVKGEGKMLLQNRPDVMTSFEDILVRHANDLVALTAIACPKGVRDHFSSEQDVKDRTRRVCEMMEQYVKLFGAGKMSNLVFSRDQSGGSGRGPVDVYNKLCDELRDCKERAQALGVNLDIGPCHKFLAKDIMYWNDGWKDDAFADGKVPGWVEYLARVRMEEMALE